MWFSKCVRSLVFTLVLALAIQGFAQTNNPPIISAIDATNYLNQQVIVVDKVAQVAFRSNIWLLHLNQKYPKSPLNATVRKAATNNFPNFSDYLGQRVQITGQIIDYRGRLEIAMTTTNQIKVLGATEVVSAPAPVVAEAQTQPVSPAPPKEAVATPAPTIAAAPVTPLLPQAEDNSNRTLHWILGLLAIISILLATGIFLLWRRPKDSAPSAMALAKLPASISVESSADDWKQRALAAEAMAGKQGEILREKIMPELTEFAKQSLVQGLYAQRSLLIETQRKAQESLAELEARLNTLQAPLHERIRAYEKRIAELEQEVETQGEEMRELTRATLTLVRRKLEDERQSGQGQRLQSRLN
jgi:hypothetical protein